MCRNWRPRHARAFELTQKFVLAVLWRVVSIDLYGKRSSFGRVKAVIPARSGGQKARNLPSRVAVAGPQRRGQDAMLRRSQELRAFAFLTSHNFRCGPRDSVLK